ncbi:battenin-like isoform X2 [Sycon ciliatum]|uniref:battenin-like isoform X2 n=1 Tax=Sycon ciliatum TaxID=27933 RepID=UPI0031F5F55B
MASHGARSLDSAVAQEDEAPPPGPPARIGSRPTLWRNWIAFFLLGTINNMSYVIINSSAKTIADSFHKSDDVSLIPWANVAFGFGAKCLNAFVLVPLGVPYGIRIFVNGVLMLGGLIGIAFAPSFTVAIVAIVVSGSTAGFGENVVLGYLRLYNPDLITAWSSGTGMAGVLGATLYIGLSCAVQTPPGTSRNDKLLHMNHYVFLLATPIVLIYWLAYFVILKKPDEQQPALTREEQESSKYRTSETTPLIQESVSESRSIEAAESGCSRLGRCLCSSAWLSFNLGAVYFTEYVARSCSAKAKEKGDPIYTPTCPEFYAAIQLCYQAGVLVSRSSLGLVQIKRVGILTILQTINMVVWIIIAWNHFMPVAVLPAYMIFVGLLGGASYVNTFNLLRSDTNIADGDRELCINIAGLTISLGIFAGTGFNTLLFHLAGFK